MDLPDSPQISAQLIKLRNKEDHPEPDRDVRIDPPRNIRDSCVNSHGKAATIVTGSVKAFHGHVLFSSALNAAVAAGQIENVRALLKMLQTDPNGFPQDHFSRASTLFLRFRPPWIKSDGNFRLRWTRERVMSRRQKQNLSPEQPGSRDRSHTPSIKGQASPLTFEELAERRVGRSRFWAEKNFPQLLADTFGKPKAPMTSVELAALCGRTDVLDCLIDAGADTQAWLKTNNREFGGEIPTPASPSFLSVSTPLHRAVDGRKTEMLEYLLQLGHDPDFFPPAVITRSLSATMYAIAQGRDSSGTSSADVWPQGLKMLLAKTDFGKRTPIFNCHCLHIAAATLDLGVFLEVLEWTCVSNANLFHLKPTALGHTPLHVACLPLDDTMVNLHSRAIHQSIHTVRTLGEDWKACKMHAYAGSEAPAWGAGARETRGYLGSQGGIYSSMLGDYTSDYADTPAATMEAVSQRVQAEHEAQLELVKYLLEVCYESDPCGALALRDIHGNTAWHYLASYRDINAPLWGYLGSRGLGFDEDALNTVKNDWGFTARDLAESNRRAQWGQFTLEGYWPFWDDVISGGKGRLRFE